MAVDEAQRIKSMRHILVAAEALLDAQMIEVLVLQLNAGEVADTYEALNRLHEKVLAAHTRLRHRYPASVQRAQEAMVQMEMGFEEEEPLA